MAARWGARVAQYFLNDAWTGKANHEFVFGRQLDRAYAGDWNGDGRDTLGVRRDPNPLGTARAARWAAAEYGTFTVTTHTGSGDAVIPLPAGAHAGIVDATHSGSGYFSARMAVTHQALFLGDDNFTGTAAFGLDPQQPAGPRIEINARGSGTIRIQPVSAAAPLQPSGGAPGVFLYDGPASTVMVVHGEDTWFTIDQHAGDRHASVANVLHPATSASTLFAGPSVVTVVTRDPWALSIP